MARDRSNLEEIDFELISSVSVDEKLAIQKSYPGLSDAVFVPTKAKGEDRYKVILGDGQGAFSKITFAKAKMGTEIKYFAVKKVKSESKLNASSNQIPINRDKILMMMEGEITVQRRIAEVVHDHVAIIHHVIKKENKNGEPQLYQILPLADIGSGERLLTLIENNQLSLEKKNKLFLHIACVLLNTVAILNDNLIFNNDIKLENILFSSQGEMLIADFGSTFFYKNKKLFAASSLYTDACTHPIILFVKNQHNPELKRSLSLPEKGGLRDSWSVGLTLLEFYSPKTREIALKIKEKSGLFGFNRLPVIHDEYKKVFDELYRCDEFNQIPEPIKTLITQLLELDINEYQMLSELLKQGLLPRDYFLPQVEVQQILTEAISNEAHHPNDINAEVVVEPATQAKPLQARSVDFRSTVYKYYNIPLRLHAATPAPTQSEEEPHTNTLDEVILPQKK